MENSGLSPDQSNISMSDSSPQQHDLHDLHDLPSPQVPSTPISNLEASLFDGNGTDEVTLSKDFIDDFEHGLNYSLVDAITSLSPLPPPVETQVETGTSTSTTTTSTTVTSTVVPEEEEEEEKEDLSVPVPVVPMKSDSTMDSKPKVKSNK